MRIYARRLKHRGDQCLGFSLNSYGICVNLWWCYVAFDWIEW